MISAWAMRNNWRSDAANQLHDIAEGILVGKRFKRLHRR